MVKTLLKKQLTEIFRSYFYNPKTNKARSRTGTILSFVLFVLIMAGMLGGMFAFMSISLCAPLVFAGVGWLYFSICGAIAILLGIFGSVFNTYSGLFLAKDNDLLLSMPIPVRAIMISRLLGVYLMGLMYSSVVLIPTVVVYLIVVPFSVGALLGCILFIILISIFVLTLSCLLGWVVAKASLKLKSKSFVVVLISLLFVALYYFVYFKAMNMIRDLVANAAVYGAQIHDKAMALYYFGRVGEGDPLAIAVCAAFVLLLFALTWRLLGRSFLAVATSTGAAGKVRYTARRVGQRSISAALLGKELGKFTSSPNYMLNCGLGTLLIPIIGVLLLIRGGALADALGKVFGGDTGLITVLVAAALCAVAAMNDMAAPSVSLEGKNIWLPQSLPVEPWQVLRAKLRLQLWLTMPPLLFASLCAAAAIKPDAAEFAALIVLPQTYALLFALLALTLDVKHANLDWTSELVPIKQSFTVLAVLFGSWIYSAAVALPYLLLGMPLGAELYLFGFAALTAAASLLLYLWLRGKGAKLFSEL